MTIFRFGGPGAGKLAFLCALLVGLFGQFGALHAKDAAPAKVSECRGTDLLAKLRVDDPAAYDAVISVARANRNSGSLLWRIRRDGVADSYLFGTIHMTDARVNDLPREVVSALRSSKLLALELVDATPQNVAIAMQSLGPKLMFTDGRQLSQFLSGKEFDLASKVLAANGVPAAAVNIFKPWIVSVFLAVSQCEHNRVAAGLKPMDARLELRAKSLGLKLVGLETIPEQLDAMAGLPIAAQAAWLKATIQMYHQIDDHMETLVQLYLKRRISAVWPLTERLIGDKLMANRALGEFKHALVVIRNKRMRDRLLPLLKKGGVFVAVGALHLPGSDGLVQLIADAGYTLEPAEAGSAGD